MAVGIVIMIVIVLLSGGGGGKGWGPETSKQPSGRQGPAEQGSAGRPRKYSPFRRESKGTSTVVPLLSLLTGEYFRGRSALPFPAGSGRPDGCFDVSVPRPFPPLPPSLFHCHRRWVAQSPNGASSIVDSSVTTPRHGCGHGPNVSTLARRGTKQCISWNHTVYHAGRPCQEL